MLHGEWGPKQKGDRKQTFKIDGFVERAPRDAMKQQLKEMCIIKQSEQVFSN